MNALSPAPAALLPLGRRIFAMSWPNILYSVLDAGMGVVDLWLVGRLGAEAVAGVGLSRQVYFLVMIIAVAVTAGATPLVAQASGRGDRERIGGVARQLLGMVTVLGVFSALLLAWGARPALILLDAPDEVQHQGRLYLMALAPGVIFTYSNFAMVSLFRGIGQVRVPLLAAAVMHAVNLPLSYALINGLGDWLAPMGIAGAAVGTVVAQACGMLVNLGSWYWRCDRPLRLTGVILPWWQPSLVRAVLKLGVPISAMHLSRMLAHAMFFHVMAAAGTLALAAASLTYQLRLLLIYPSLAVNVAVITLVGQSLGAGDEALARRYARQTLAWGTLIGALLAGVAIVWARPLLQVLCHFTGRETGDQLLELGVPMIRISFIGQVFATASIIVNGAFIGGGDLRWPFVYTLVTEWLIMLPITWIVLHWTHLPVSAVWWGFAIAPAVLFWLYERRFRTRVWLRRL
jgi:putative MATE family efflux protein